MNLVRAYSYANDYAITEGWRQKHGQPPLPPAIFGSNVEGEPIPGVVVYDSETGEDYAAAWLYKDRCGVLCWMAWTVTNPDVPAAKAVAAIDTAEDFLETIATEEGFLIMVGMFNIAYTNIEPTFGKLHCFFHICWSFDRAPPDGTYRSVYF